MWRHAITGGGLDALRHRLDAGFTVDRPRDSELVDQGAERVAQNVFWSGIWILPFSDSA
jgi:hypothetical protein